MASDVSDSLGLELQKDGENTNTWGLVTNRNLQMLERAVSGYTDIAISSATTTLTRTAFTLGDWQHMGLRFIGTLTANSVVVVPGYDKLYVVENATSGAFTLTVKTAGGSGVVIPAGTRAILACDGTNVSGTVLQPYDPDLAGLGAAVTMTGANAAFSGSVRAASSTFVPTTSAAAAAIVADGAFGGGLLCKDGSGYGGLWMDGGGANLRIGLGTGTALSEKVAILSNGNVGIGVTNPLQRLVVSGRTTLAGLDEAYALYLQFNAGTQGGYIGSPGSDALGIFHAGGGEKIRFDLGNGNVGVGTATPLAKVEVVGQVRAHATVEPGQLGSNFAAIAPGVNGARAGYSFWPVFDGTPDISARRAADILAGFNGGAWGTEFLAFHVADGSDAYNVTTERVRIDAAGNVGINTLVPGARLHVVGEARVQHMQNALVTARSFVQPEGPAHYSAGQRTAYMLDNGAVVGAFDHVRTGAGSFEFRISNWDGATLNRRFVLDGSGNVGIGTNSPDVALDIEKTGAQLRVSDGTVDLRLLPLAGSAVGIVGTLSNHDLVLYANNAEVLRAEVGGNVGIAKSDPTSKLHLGTGDIRVDGSDSPVFIRSSGTPITGGVGLRGGSAADSFNLFVESHSGIQFNIDSDGNQGGAQAGMLIRADGYVGIGTVNPAEKLHVNGTVLGNFLKAEGGSVQVGSSGGTYVTFRYDGTVSAGGGAFYPLLTNQSTLDVTKLSAAIPNSHMPERVKDYGQNIGDWNDARTNGWYMAADALNAPVATGWFLGTVEVHNDGWMTQTVHSFTDSNETNTISYRRHRQNGIWTAWYRLRLSEAEQSALYVTKTGDSVVNGKVRIVGTDVYNNFVASGATKAIRLGADSARAKIEAVDQTGVTSFQPLYVGGSTVTFHTSETERLTIAANGDVALGRAPLNNAGFTTLTVGSTNGGALELSDAAGSYFGRLYSDVGSTSVNLENARNGDVIIRANGKEAIRARAADGVVVTGHLTVGAPAGYSGPEGGQIDLTRADGSNAALSIDAYGDVMRFMVPSTYNFTTVGFQYFTHSDSHVAFERPQGPHGFMFRVNGLGDRIAITDTALNAAVPYSGTSAYFNTGLGVSEGSPTNGDKMASRVTVTGMSNHVMYGVNSGWRLLCYTDGLGHVAGIDAAGTLVSRSGSIAVISDEREKKDIAVLGYGLDAILALSPKQFRLNEDDPADPLRFGFIAQDIQPLIPELVSSRDISGSDELDDRERLNLKEGSLLPIAIKAIQELTARVAALEAQLNP